MNFKKFYIILLFIKPFSQSDLHSAYCSREAEKVSPLKVRPLRRGGGGQGRIRTSFEAVKKKKKRFA